MTNVFTPNTVVQRYRLDEVIGTGGMGTVYRATHLDSGQHVAVKALHPHIAKKAEHQKRFLREARAAMATNHPNVVKILEVFEHDDAPMIAMELLVGESLEKMILRERRIPLDRLARIMVRVTSAVGTAHSLGIVHRDLKPDNIFIGSEGDNQVKVLDFGIAKLTATEGAAAETAALTRTGMLMGTPFYMSPEQAFGEKKVDHRSDIWSLGVIIYYALSGTLLTYGNSFADVFRLVVQGEFRPVDQLVPGTPKDVVSLVDRMLKRDPADRPWDLREVHTLFGRYTEIVAPSFGVAVAPLFDELSSEGEEDDARAAERASAPAISAASAGIAFAPTSLRLTPGGQGLGTTPGGTVTMEAPATPSRLSAAGGPPSGDRSAPTLMTSPAASPLPITAIVAVIVIVVAGVVAALVLR